MPTSPDDGPDSISRVDRRTARGASVRGASPPTPPGTTGAGPSWPTTSQTCVSAGSCRCSSRPSSAAAERATPRPVPCWPSWPTAARPRPSHSRCTRTWWPPRSGVTGAACPRPCWRRSPTSSSCSSRPAPRTGSTRTARRPRPTAATACRAARRRPAAAPAGDVLVTSIRWDDAPDGPQVIHAAVPFAADGRECRTDVGHARDAGHRVRHRRARRRLRTRRGGGADPSGGRVAPRLEAWPRSTSPTTSGTTGPSPSRCSRPELAATLGTERFLREIRIAARLQHPHILPLLRFRRGRGPAVYYVMPFVEGESLRDRLAREGQLPLDEARADRRARSPRRWPTPTRTA